MIEKMKREIRNALPVIWGRIKQDIGQHGAGVLAVVVLYFVMHALFGAFCPSVIVTGFPCPGCGMTRAVLYLLKGQFLRSWALNPAAGLWGLWALWFAFERYIRGQKCKGLTWALCGIALFMISVYLIRMVRYCPDRPPYVYTPNNLFSRIIPGYRSIIKHLLGR